MLTAKLIVLADSIGTCVPHDEAFARRLQESGATESSKNYGIRISLHCNQFLSISNLARAIDVQHANREEHCQTLNNRLSDEGKFCDTNLYFISSWSIVISNLM